MRYISILIIDLSLYLFFFIKLESGQAICEQFLRSACSRGGYCPYRHVRGDKAVICKHWLRGLCKKGDECEFLHEYDMSKMPECYFYSKYAQCGNKECEFLHLDKESKIKDCAWYDRGFCRHGKLSFNVGRLIILFHF